jgi:hypothetical protein
MRDGGGFRAPALGILALATLFWAAGASAEADAKSAYSKGQTYSAALRYLRVDLGYEIVEKDPDAAYLLFRYTPTGRREPTNGSIEVVETRTEVRVVVQLPQLPHYHETMLRDGLLAKLRKEYGEPPPARKPTPKDKPDGGEKPKDKDKPREEKDPDSKGK